MSKFLFEVYNVARANVYATLLAGPDREWTVRELADRMPETANLSRDAVRSNLYLLLAGDVMDLVLDRRAMTLKFKDRGAATLQAIVSRWRKSGWWIPT